MTIAKLLLAGIAVAYFGLLVGSALCQLVIHTGLTKPDPLITDALDPAVIRCAALCQWGAILILSFVASWALVAGRLDKEGWRVGWMFNPATVLVGWILYFASAPFSPPPEYLSSVTLLLLLPGAFVVWLVNAFVVRRVWVR